VVWWWKTLGRSLPVSSTVVFDLCGN